jgi:hypothetical protein
MTHSRAAHFASTIRASSGLRRCNGVCVRAHARVCLAQAPVKDVLVFISIDPPDLDAARSYDDGGGSRRCRAHATNGDRAAEITWEHETILTISPLRSPGQPASAEGAYVCFARACACARTCARAHRETLLGAGRSLESAHVVAALSREPLLNDQGHMVSALLRSSSFRCTPEAIHPRTPRRFAWEPHGTVHLAIQITAVRTLSDLRLAFQEPRCTFSGTLSVV